MAGRKPSKGTPYDRRLKQNRDRPKHTTSANQALRRRSK